MLLEGQPLLKECAQTNDSIKYFLFQNVIDNILKDAVSMGKNQNSNNFCLFCSGISLRQYLGALNSTTSTKMSTTTRFLFFNNSLLQTHIRLRFGLCKKTGYY